MGKYIRKQKLTGDIVAVIDVSQSLGVRTRATTLALQKLQALKTTVTPSPEQHHELSYLQLRSRKLEKPPLKQTACCTQRNPRLNTSRLAIRSVSAGSGSCSGDLQSKVDEKTEDCCDFGTEETCFGDNNVDLDDKERKNLVSKIGSTRESTPCSFIRDSNDCITPGSSTRHTVVSNSFQRIMPSAQEIEEFFARHAQEQQRLFSEKYNFDITNEKPLQGRYEWVRVQP